MGGEKKQGRLDYQEGLEDGWIDRTIKEFKDADRENANELPHVARKVSLSG